MHLLLPFLICCYLKYTVDRMGNYYGICVQERILMRIKRTIWKCFNSPFDFKV